MPRPDSDDLDRNAERENNLERDSHRQPAYRLKAALTRDDGLERTAMAAPIVRQPPSEIVALLDERRGLLGELRHTKDKDTRASLAAQLTILDLRISEAQS